MAKLKWWDWVLGVLVGLALVNWSTVDIFDFNIVEFITFGVGWLATVVYLIVSIFGVILLGRLFLKILK